jgi:hypothetical protein
MTTCPRCGKRTSDFMNAGRGHFALCHHCRAYFFFGSGIFTVRQSEEEQKRIWAEWAEEKGYRFLEAPKKPEELGCGGCAAFDANTGMDGLGKCMATGAYREPEDWCEQAVKWEDPS